MPAIRTLPVPLLILGLAACGGKDAPPPAPPVPEVGVVTLQPRDVALSTELPGRTSPHLIAEVRPQVSGIVLERAFEEGARVEAGQVLYRIDPGPYRAALARAEAAATAARLLSERYEQLGQSEAISRQARDDARAQYLQAKAAADAARIDVGYTRITAPISGRIGRSAITQGALVTAGQPQALATVQQLDPIYVDVTQPSTALLGLRRDLAEGRLREAGDGAAEVALRLEDGSAYPIKGALQFSEVSVDEGTGAVTLRARFPNPDGVLMPGMFVRAELQQGVRGGAITVPQRGITRDTAGEAVAMVVGRDGRVQPRRVVTDRSVGSDWVVSEGLAAGDRVIVDGLHAVRPGMPVKPVPVKAGAAPAATPAPAAATPTPDDAAAPAAGATR